MIVFLVLSLVFVLGLIANLSNQFPTDEETCKITVNYRFVDCDDNVTNRNNYENVYTKGEQVNIPTPVVEGYTPDKECVKIVADTDMVFNVTYTCNSHVVQVYDPAVFDYDSEQHWACHRCTICGAIGQRDEYETHFLFGVDSTEEVVVDNRHYRKNYCYCGYYELDSSDYHDFEVLRIDYYPSETRSGSYAIGCRMCDETYSEVEFDVLTQSIIFGGDIINTIKDFSVSYEGYLLSGNNANLVRLASNVPEFTYLENGGVYILNGNTLNPKINVTLEYDENVWGENAISFKRNLNDTTDTKFSVSIGNNYRIVFKIEDKSGLPTWLEWLQDENCPLAISPIRLIVSYDFN